MTPLSLDGDLDNRGPIARWYGLVAAQEWQRVISHFALADGFALIVLIVPDRDGARICRTELERVLRDQSKTLVCSEPAEPPQLRQLATGLLDRPGDAEERAAWIEAVVPESAADFPAWRAAWLAMLEGLNQQRNPLRRFYGDAMLIVAAPWVVPLFRDVAPDLWSVRSQVVRIEPDRDRRAGRSDDIGRGLSRQSELVPADAPDPEFALQEAERLSGLPNRLGDRAMLLTRAGVA